MDNAELWDRFAMSGRVEDYLKYRINNTSDYQDEKETSFDGGSEYGGCDNTYRN